VRKRRYLHGLENNGAYAPTPYDAVPTRYAVVEMLGRLPLITEIHKRGTKKG